MSQFTEDKIIFETIEKELHRQQQGIELIASENFIIRRSFTCTKEVF